MEQLKQFNDTTENIIYIKEHRSYTFAVTCQETVNYAGRIDSVCFYGYILEHCQGQFISGHHIVELVCEAVYDLDYGYLKEVAINDFLTTKRYQSMGFGSIVLEQLIQYAEHVEAEYIFGWLSPEDIGKDNDLDSKKKENRKRLYHFYQKHGFVITEKHNIIFKCGQD